MSVRDNYEVLVGNIGCVYSEESRGLALRVYRDYVDISKAGAGRAAGENVTLMINGEPEVDYVGTVARYLDTPQEE